VQTWIDRLAAALGEEPLGREDVARLLGVSREVAHRVERKVTPLAAFLLGAAVGRRQASGTSRRDALGETIAELHGILPAEPEATERPDDR
jgi:hypothetical protein